MIGIINYGLGNIKSIQNIIKHVGGNCRIINKISEIEDVEKIILPGVGSFDHGMNGLLKGNWIEPLNNLVLIKKIPVLGICLGMQLMCKSSEEGQLPGLGWIDAEVKLFDLPNDSNLKIPHMGWNTIKIVKQNPLLEIEEKEQRFYFVHSYHAVCNRTNDVLAITKYDSDFSAAFSHDNIFGVQFHPEKSHKFGMDFFKKYIEL